jgi:hypothetical protein
MFDAHAATAQGVIVGAFILRQRPCFGLLVGKFVAGMVVLEPLVTAVGRCGRLRSQQFRF